MTVVNGFLMYVFDVCSLDLLFCRFKRLHVDVGNELSYSEHISMILNVYNVYIYSIDLQFVSVPYIPIEYQFL